MKDNKIRTDMWSFIPPRERMKMILMFASVVVLGGVMVIAAIKLQPAAPGEIKDESAERAPIDTIEIEDMDDDLDVLPSDQGPRFSSARDDDQAFELYDPSILDEVVDNLLDPVTGQSQVCEVGMILLRHWLNELTQEQIREEAQASIHLHQLLEDPAAHRGKIVYVDGVLERMHRLKPKDSVAISTIYFGEIKSAAAGASSEEESQKISVYLVDGPMGARPGDDVKLYGYFLQTRKNRHDEIMPVIVGKRFEPPPWLKDSQSLDLAVEGNFSREERPVYYLKNKVMQMTPEEITGLVDASITPTDLRTDPTGNRGNFVSFEGTVMQLRRQELPPNPTGLTHCYVGYILTKERRAAFFYAIDRPAGVEEFKLGRFDGIFLKHFTYVSQSNIEQSAAVLVGRRLIPVEVRADGVYRAIFILCTAALAAVGVAGFVEVRSTKRRTEEMRRKVLKKAPSNLNKKASDAIRKAKEDRK